MLLSPKRVTRQLAGITHIAEFTADNLVVKTDCSFSRFAGPLHKRFQGRPCSVLTTKFE